MYDAIKNPQSIPQGPSKIAAPAAWSQGPIESHFLELVSSNSNVSTADLPEHIVRIKNELEEARRRLTRTRAEEADANRRRVLEDNVTEDCQVRIFLFYCLYSIDVDVDR